MPVLMITDPPYGVNYDPLWREEAGLGAQRQTGTVENDDRVDWSEARRASRFCCTRFVLESSFIAKSRSLLWRGIVRSWQDREVCFASVGLDTRFRGPE